MKKDFYLKTARFNIYSFLFSNERCHIKFYVFFINVASATEVALSKHFVQPTEGLLIAIYLGVFVAIKKRGAEITIPTSVGKNRLVFNKKYCKDSKTLEKYISVLVFNSTMSLFCEWLKEEIK